MSGEPLSQYHVRIEAPHFVAGIIMDGDRCIGGAPILKWAKGKGRDELRAYFASKGWKAQIMKDRA